jgi:alkylation response protein AidB-like acyl-CoA dehydrogenase
MGSQVENSSSNDAAEKKVSADGEEQLSASVSESDISSPVKGFFLGELSEKHLFPFPKLDSDESELIGIVLDSVDKFMAGKSDDFRDYDEKGAQPDEYVAALKELGLFGLIIPEEYGGIGLSNTGYSRVLQQSSRYDASTSLTVGAHSSIGMKGLLLFGNDNQKKKYLPALASGERIAAFCLTESGSGSDAGSIKTKADKQDDGSWILNGEKIWITNGGMAGFFTVFARTDNEHGKLSAFLVEREWEGISTGAKEDKLGIRASSTTTVMFDNVKVPAENLLGQEGKGFKIAMAILNNGRTGLGGGCVGGIKRCIELAAKQAKERKQFGQSISEFGLIKEKIAQMTIDCFAAESVVRMVGHYIDDGHEDYSVEAAISKVFATEAMWRAANESLQVAGGNGFMKEFPYERIMRDSRINMIFEGTNEILRLYIALSGMKDPGAYLSNVKKSASNIFNDPIKGFGVLSDYAGRQVSRYTSYGIDRIVEKVPSELRDESLIFETYTSELARNTDIILRRHGKSVVNKQFAMKRLGDTAIDLFVGLCVLSRVTSLIEEKGADSCVQEIAIAKSFSQQAKRRMNQNLRRILRNEDEELKALSDYIVDAEGYPWDIL